MIFTIGYQGSGYGNSSHFVRAITFLGTKKAKSVKIWLGVVSTGFEPVTSTMST